jgi:hypothetical protein
VHYKALVIANGKVVLRGDNNPQASDETTQVSGTDTDLRHNTFTGVVYALNRQMCVKNATTPCPPSADTEVVRLDQGAHVRGDVMIDGHGGKLYINQPFDANALLTSLGLCPGLACSLLQGLGINNLLTTLLGGGCLLPQLNLLGIQVGCLVSAPSASSVLSGLSAQRDKYGSAIWNYVAATNQVQVYTASSVSPGSLRAVQPTGVTLP